MGSNKWIGRMRLSIVLFVLFILVCPLVPVIIAYLRPGTPWWILLEFLIGTWPNQTYPITAEVFSTNPLLYLGIYLRALVTFAIPVALGFAFNKLGQIEKRLEQLSRVDLQVIIRHGEALKAITNDKDAIRRNVTDFARRLGATDTEIAIVLKLLDLAG